MKQRQQLLPDEAILRKSLFVPCRTREGLKRWVDTYLGIDLPDCIVDPESTSSPLDMLFELYQAAQNNSEEHSQVMVYASRDSFKTLCAAILEVLCIVHLGRSVAHMAAIETQAKKAQEYVKKFFSKPYLREFRTLANERKVELTWYMKVGGKLTEVLTVGEFGRLPVEEQNAYEEHREYISIVVCTVAGANSEHTTFMTVDEVDVIPNKEAYEESKFIPAARDGKLPITLLTSTRKYSWNLVQKEIDKAAETGLKLLHWNIIDVTEACPPAIHQPERGQEFMYVSNDALSTISEKEFLALLPDQQASYVRERSYWGCLHNCNIYAMCRGRLATEQHSNSRMLKPVKHVQALLKKTNLAKAKAQLMCWTPTNEGRIYSQFDRKTHMLTAAEIAKRLTGEDHSPDLSKKALLDLAVSMGLPFFAGMDFGMSHNFAVVLGFVALNRLYIVDCVSAAGLGPAERLEVCVDRIKPFDPAVYPDVADPTSIKFFKQAHYTMRNWTKEKGSVVGGIEIVRYKLNPLGEEPELYLLKDDDACDLLASRMEAYHWLVDAGGKTLGVPDDEDDDECDAMRYLVMNVFAPRNRSSIPTGEAPPDVNATAASQYTEANWMAKVIAENMGPDGVASQGLRIKRGGFIVDF